MASGNVFLWNLVPKYTKLFGHISEMMEQYLKFFAIQQENNQLDPAFHPGIA